MPHSSNLYPAKGQLAMIITLAVTATILGALLWYHEHMPS